MGVFKTSAEKLWEARLNGNLKAFQKILQNDPAVALQPMHGDLPIYSAARRRATDFVLALLEAGADPGRGRDMSPLAASMSGGYSPPFFARPLLQAGADPLGRDEDGDTAFHMAAARGYMDIVSAMLDKNVDIDAMDKNGDTALHKAAANERLDIVTLLLDRGAKTDIQNACGETPLSLVKEKQDSPKRLIRLLLETKLETDAAPWTRIEKDSIAQVRAPPALKRAITEIFSFASRERLIISQNLATGAEAVETTRFRDIERPVLEQAVAAFKTLGARSMKRPSSGPRP